MSGDPPEGKPEDWMEMWFETGEITWQKPLSPEAIERIQKLYSNLLAEQQQEDGRKAGEASDD
ncbi:hypothetical protein ACIQNU_04575 [Streptomyces sp. NPDC091292]|uniref:hypothetical protein n=1 Tax=Streptomyces sp. NPDC091292 TaxID=3365991 RepID=UPI0037FF8343